MLDCIIFKCALNIWSFIYEKTFQYVIEVSQCEAVVHYPQCQPANGVRPSNLCLSVWQPSPAPCCSMVFFPSLGTADPMFTPGKRAGGFNNVSKMPLYIPDTPVALCQAALRPHVHPTTYCVGTSWVDLLDVMIRHLPFNKLRSDPWITLDYTGFRQAKRSWLPLILDQYMCWPSKHHLWFLIYR